MIDRFKGLKWASTADWLPPKIHDCSALINSIIVQITL